MELHPSAHVVREQVRRQIAASFDALDARQQRIVDFEGLLKKQSTVYSSKIAAARRELDVLIGTQTPALILAETARLEAHTAGRDAARFASTLAIAHTKAAVEAAGPPPPIEETVPMSAWFNAPALRIGLEYSSSIP